MQGTTYFACSLISEIIIIQHNVVLCDIVYYYIPLFLLYTTTFAILFALNHIWKKLQNKRKRNLQRLYAKRIEIREQIISRLCKPYNYSTITSLNIEKNSY